MLVRHHVLLKLLIIFTAVKGCPLPMSPEHGHLSCETPESARGSDINSTGDLLDEGSVCRYDCDPGYTVPPSQAHLAVIQCRFHSWNSTADPSCEGEFSVHVYFDQKHFCSFSIIHVTSIQTLPKGMKFFPPLHSSIKYGIILGAIHPTLRRYLLYRRKPLKLLVVPNLEIYKHIYLRD